MNANWLWLIAPAFLAGASFEAILLDNKDPYWGKGYRDGYNDGYNDGYLAGQPNNPMDYSILPILLILVPLAFLFLIVGAVLRWYKKRTEADNG